tara:strand:- start:304 stop:702 length:399 start_codon:yes stop_codon:yes gene_type:complete
MLKKFSIIKFLKNFIINFQKYFGLLSIVFIIWSTFLIFSNQLLALNNSQGEKLFLQHCSGCHVKGGNIIRRNKTLKLSSLKRNGIDSPKEIAKIARFGIGSMNGYEEFLGKDGDQIVANWIWEQSQKAWVQE